MPACSHSLVRVLNLSAHSFLPLLSPQLVAPFCANYASVGRLCYVGLLSPQLDVSAIWDLCLSYVVSTIWDYDRLCYETIVVSAMGSWSPQLVAPTTQDLCRVATWDFGRFRYVGP